MIGKGYADEEEEPTNTQNAAGVSGDQEMEMEQREHVTNELNLHEEQFLGHDIIESFYNVNAEMMYLKKSMKKHMADRDKKEENIKELKKDNSELMQIVETLLEEFMRQEQTLEKEILNAPKELERANEMQ